MRGDDDEEFRIVAGVLLDPISLESTVLNACAGNHTMSILRPMLRTNVNSNITTMRNGTAYLLIYRAVQDAPGLIHGRLHGEVGEHCAIGHYFERHGQTALPSELIDEVAAVNDSTPTVSQQERKRHVLKWLRWKLKQVGMPEFSGAKQP